MRLGQITLRMVVFTAIILDGSGGAVGVALGVVLGIVLVAAMQLFSTRDHPQE